MRAIGEEAVGAAFGERRVGEQRRRDRLQREAHAQLLHHVGFGAEIEIGLHRTRAEHHLPPEPADLLHVGLHDPVAALGHHRRLFERPQRREAEAEEVDVHRLGRRRAVSRRCSPISAQVWWMFSSGAPDSSNWPPGSRLIDAMPFFSADDVPALDDRRPAVIVARGLPAARR